MKVFINVATAEKGIILYEDSQIRDGIFWNEAGAELKWVLPSLYKLLQNNELKIEEDIEKIVIVSGPGSFTGIRIAVSIVNTLKYLYPHIHVSALSTGELLAAVDSSKHSQYLFQVFASDIFVFNKEGIFQGRKSIEDLTDYDIENSTGSLMGDALKNYPEFEMIPEMSHWRIEKILCIDTKSIEVQDLAEPFYGKGANITVPKISQ
ncbi:MAG: hypothetical protein ACK4NC_00540 [Candidatus Gracilibacteria bacterium]